MGLYNRAIETQRTPSRPETHEGVLKKLLRANPDTRRYAPTDNGRYAAAAEKRTSEPIMSLTARDIEKKKN
ncbi:MAG: hypothetical protein EA426_04465 [Spirochaetaceae bacterium]|nr:MAG: hypothetical protein EA426_04465 [Spirochaetaceae bacterium]